MHSYWHPLLTKQPHIQQQRYHIYLATDLSHPAKSGLPKAGLNTLNGRSTLEQMWPLADSIGSCSLTSGMATRSRDMHGYIEKRIQN